MLPLSYRPVEITVTAREHEVAVRGSGNPVGCLMARLSMACPRLVVQRLS